eukprot:2454534-Prymnesium_polylepis.1
MRAVLAQRHSAVLTLGSGAASAQHCLSRQSRRPTRTLAGRVARARYSACDDLRSAPLAGQPDAQPQYTTC